VSPNALIITLDGGTWKILDELITREKMPYLSSLRSTGTSGTLETVVPPLTTTAWASFQTGTNPGRHGIFNFYGSGWPPRDEVANATDIPQYTLWELLDYHGNRTVSVDLPLTYPPSDIDGVFVGGLGNPTVDSLYAHPDESVWGDWNESDFPLASNDIYELSSRYKPLIDQEGLEQLTELFRCSVENKSRFGAELLESTTWDVGVVHFAETDLFQHLVWPALYSEHRHFDEEQFEIVTLVHEEIDAALERIISTAKTEVGEDLLVMLLSDHGHQSQLCRVFFNNHLKKKGLYEDLPADPGLATRTLDAVKGSIRRLPPSVRKAGMAVTPVKRFYERFILDPTQLDNTDVREQSSYFVVEGCHYAQVLVFTDDVTQSDIEADLADIKDPETGEPVVEEIKHVTEFYEPDVETYPEYFLRLSDGYLAKGGHHNDSSAPVFDDIDELRNWASSTHDLKGIFLLHGPMVSPGERDASLIDLPATLLQHFDIPFPQSIDGRSLSSVFTDTWQSERSIESKSYDFDIERGEFKQSQQEQKRVRRQLSAMGYIEES
jgi:predicted AlkP superfamily phosphohydrolase/phosphomutase